MKIGEFFNVEGYDEMAKAQTDHGCVVVYSNNSSHLLVATIVDESMTDGEGVFARLEASFPYAEPSEDGKGWVKGGRHWITVYQDALKKMIEITMRWTGE